MKSWIEVKNRKQAEAIRLALSRPSVRAFVVTVGTLMTLPTDRARARVLWFVQDRFDEIAEETRRTEGHDAIVR